MMRHVFYMKRSAKGAISIFLILIFVATYVIAGLLVDGGRYRMARVMAESALDSANQSILSYYNQMLYDLYGLFAVDSDSITTEQIAGVLEDYVSHTLQTADINYDEYSTGLTNWLLEGSWQPGEDTQYFNDYDFQIEVKDAGSSVTLASTDYVEDQIVEYMKYRAPIEMVTGADSFLGKLKGIVEIKDRLVAIQDQISITNSYKDVFQAGAELIQEINSFNEDIIAFCNNPLEPQSFRQEMVQGVAGGSYQMTGEKDDQGNYNLENAADLYELSGKSFDEKLEEIGGYTMEQKGTEPVDPEEAEETGVTERPVYETPEELKQRQADAYQEAKKAFLESLDPLFRNAETLHHRANALRDQVEVVNNQYNAYIEALEAELSLHGDNEQYKTVYEPEIALAKSSCGEILKGIDLILSSRQFTNELEKLGSGSDRSAFETGLEGLIDHRLNGGSPSDLKSALAAGESGRWAGETVYLYFQAAQDNLRSLMSEVSYYYKCHKAEADLIEGDQEIDSEPDVNKEEENKITPKDLNEEDLAVAYTHGDPGGFEQYFKLDSKVSAENSTMIMEAGLALVRMLEDVLEGVRDNLYVNEYILATFPNVVMAKDLPDDLTQLQQRRFDAEQIATVAGVEYLLIGGTDSSLNVLGVDAELLGVRSIFNTVAIFTDTAKRHQALTIATAISGPYAPLVSIVLLIAWALAESALDVVSLKNGEDVLLFKTGKDWQFSVEGAVNKLVDVVVDAAVDGVMDILSNIHSQLEDTANGAIYEVFNGVSGARDQLVSQAVSTASGKVKDLTGQMVENSGGDAACSAIMNTVNGTFDAALENVQNRVTDWSDELINDGRDYAVKVVNESMDKVFDKAESVIEEQAEKLSDKVKESIKGKIPINKTGNTGLSLGVTLNYEDYLRIFLLMMNQQKKVERIQSLIQANMIQGGYENFRMENSAVAVWADMECEIRYLFMTNAILPEGLKRQGRMQFEVHSALSY